MVMLLLACKVVRAPHAPAEEVDSGWSYTPPDAAEPIWTADEVVAQLDAAVQELPDAEAVVDEYLELLSQGDPECPGSDTHIDSAVLGLEGCTASTGYSYAGEASIVDGSWGDGQSLTLGADCVITGPSGELFEAGGYATTESTGNGWYQLVQGTFTTEGTTWSAGLELTEGSVRGGWSRDGLAVVFDDVTLGDGCAGGALELAQAGEGWYRLVLGCDGCGAVAWGDTHVGTGCLDLDALAAELAR